MDKATKNARQRVVGKTYYAKLKSEGRCVSCAEPSDAGLRCTRCREKLKAATAKAGKALYERRKAAGLCTRCGSPRDGKSTTLCTRCSPGQYGLVKKLRNARIAAKRCIKCPKKATHGRFCKLCREKHLAARKKFYDQRRHAAFMAYGGYRCNCPGCPITEPQFLQIDHVNNDGAKHRKTIGRSGLYAWLKKHNYPPGFQVLCANCNSAKGRYGCCPHLRKAV